jgi:hypothetical protein
MSRHTSHWAVQVKQLTETYPGGVEAARASGGLAGDCYVNAFTARATISPINVRATVA